jgi:cephalosporin hydroxylase
MRRAEYERNGHVLKEMKIYSNLVSPGSYLAVQDTNLNGHTIQSGFLGRWRPCKTS